MLRGTDSHFFNFNGELERFFLILMSNSVCLDYSQYGGDYPRNP